MVNLPWLTVHFGQFTLCQYDEVLFSLFHADDSNIHVAPFLGTSVLDAMSSLVTVDLMLCLLRRGVVVSLLFSRAFRFALCQCGIASLTHVLALVLLRFGADRRSISS